MEKTRGCGEGDGWCAFWDFCFHTLYVYVADLIVPISPKSGPFLEIFCVIRFSTLCTKTHFPENQKS